MDQTPIINAAATGSHAIATQVATGQRFAVVGRSPQRNLVLAAVDTHGRLCGGEIETTCEDLGSLLISFGARGLTHQDR